MLNQIVLMGRLTGAPDLRYTQSNTPVASFRIAVDRDYVAGQEKKTDFIDCVAWRSSAEFVNKHFTKGIMIIVTGRLQIREWIDHEQNKRTSAEVVAEHILFGESKKKEEQSPFPPGVTGRVDKSKFQELPETDGDLPFD